LPIDNFPHSAKYPFLLLQDVSVIRLPAVTPTRLLLLSRRRRRSEMTSAGQSLYAHILYFNNAAMLQLDSATQTSSRQRAPVFLSQIQVAPEGRHGFQQIHLLISKTRKEIQA